MKEVRGVGDADGDGNDDIAVGAYKADGAATGSGEAYLFYGNVTGNKASSSADVRFAGAADGDGFGIAISGGFDWDDDGAPDVAVGAYTRTKTYDETGSVYLFDGPFAATENASSAYATWTGTRDYQNLGVRIEGGDFDGDGTDDIVFADQYDYAYLYAGPMASGTRSMTAYTACFSYAEAPRLAVADADGDGVDDLAMGNPDNSAIRDYAGEVAVNYAPYSGTVSFSSSADATFNGLDEDEYYGSNLALGDLDGDGYVDLAAGAPGNDDGGSAAGAGYVHVGPFVGDVDCTDALVELTGTHAADGLGSASAVGDFDGDGQDDLLLGASANDDGGTSAGAAYILYGPATAAWDLSSTATFVGEDAADAAGSRVANAGDVDRDGNTDLLISAPYDDDAASDAGAAYLFLGGGT